MVFIAIEEPSVYNISGVEKWFDNGNEFIDLVLHLYFLLNKGVNS